MKLQSTDPFPNIFSDKINLRQVLLSDIVDIVEISFYDSVQATSIEEATVMLEKIEQNYRDGSSIHWGIAVPSSNTIIGTCGYYRGLHKGAGELGCILLPKYRGYGFMTNALQLAIQFGLNDLGLNRIWASTTIGNNNAINLLERLHFVKVTDLDNDHLEYELK